MPATPHAYLDARVKTASQPELQLMLLDGALRFARQAAKQIGADAQRLETDRLLARALDIAEELVRSVSAAKTDASARLAEEYAFAFRQLTAAQINQDPTALDAAIQLLSFHRETWRLACERLQGPAASPNAPHAAPERLSLEA
jgi:flagellar protein FliS